MTRKRRRTPALRSAHRRSHAVERSSRGSVADHASALPADAARLATDMVRLAVASSTLAVGYAVTARHTLDEHLAAKCSALAGLHRVIAADLAMLIALSGALPPRVTSTCGERLRWEWLASSARLIDGAAEDRLLAECARIQHEADDAAALVERCGARLPAGVRQRLVDGRRPPRA